MLGERTRVYYIICCTLITVKFRLYCSSTCYDFEKHCYGQPRVCYAWFRDWGGREGAREGGKLQGRYPAEEDTSQYTVHKTTHSAALRLWYYKWKIVNGYCDASQWIVWQVDDMILCDGNYGLGVYGMEWVHNREPEGSRVTSWYIIIQL